jgi:predicted RNA-binding Zn-ribbon protein involved in translation (DUF1610 family)
MIEQQEACRSCRERAAVGEFEAGRLRMIDDLEQTGRHESTDASLTNYVYFKCTKCSQNWMLRDDASVRGPARYLSRHRR